MANTVGKRTSPIVNEAMRQWDRAFLTGVEFGIRFAERGENLQMAQEKAKTALRNARLTKEKPAK